MGSPARRWRDSATVKGGGQRTSMYMSKDALDRLKVVAGWYSLSKSSLVELLVEEAHRKGRPKGDVTMAAAELLGEDQAHEAWREDHYAKIKEQDGRRRKKGKR